jgi:hypothetical protein
MDVSDASYYIKPKNNKIKVAEWGTPKKIFKKRGFGKKECLNIHVGKVHIIR